MACFLAIWPHSATLDSNMAIMHVDVEMLMISVIIEVFVGLQNVVKRVFMVAMGTLMWAERRTITHLRKTYGVV